MHYRAQPTTLSMNPFNGSPVLSSVTSSVNQDEMNEYQNDLQSLLQTPTVIPNRARIIDRLVHGCAPPQQHKKFITVKELCMAKAPPLPSLQDDDALILSTETALSKLRKNNPNTRVTKVKLLNRNKLIPSNSISPKRPSKYALEAHNDSQNDCKVTAVPNQPKVSNAMGKEFLKTVVSEPNSYKLDPSIYTNVKLANPAA